MFPLYTQSFPANPSELAKLLNESLRRIFVVEKEPVTVHGSSYPELEGIDINLDRGALRQNPPGPPEVKGQRTAALQVENLQLRASDLTIGPARANLRMEARDVRLDQGFDSDKQIVLLLQGAADGEIEISVNKNDLEAAIAAVARTEAAKQGVTVEEVTLTLRDRGPRGVSGEVQVGARKLFFKTVLRIRGDLDLDDKLNATISGLSCKGDGAVGSLACGVLAPHLQKLDGRTFPLMALPLGEVRLRDVRISAAERITVNAEFGA